MIDPRDHTADHPALKPLTDRLAQGLKARKSRALQAPPGMVDLWKWCSPIEHQGELGSWTAHAAVGVVEYFQRRRFGTQHDGSRLFVYKTSWKASSMKSQVREVTGAVESKS